MATEKLVLIPPRLASKVNCVSAYGRRKIRGPVCPHHNMTISTESFLNARTPEALASLFGTHYGALSKVFYRTPKAYQYHHFEIPKKLGGMRKICTPNKKIKEVQKELADVLLRLYKARPPVHGFVRERSIVTNATGHLDKRYIFNIDLEDFFGSIHFGRVKYLFQSEPFHFPHSVATVLAHISCFENALPQGAPTSPVVTNLICWKMDAQLLRLAKTYNCTYSRYVDDLTFSFTCRKSRLPRSIVIMNEEGLDVGAELDKMITDNVFTINSEKVRIASAGQRMEVTGITVNEFPNVKREYIRQLKSILHACRKYGYVAAEKEFHEKYYKKIRASGSLPPLANVLKGKLSFLHSVKGKRDPVFINVAKQFNALSLPGVTPISYIETTTEEQDIASCTWVIESIYDAKDGGVRGTQGTGFILDGYGLITCAHVVMENDLAHQQRTVR